MFPRAAALALRLLRLAIADLILPSLKPPPRDVRGHLPRAPVIIDRTVITALNSECEARDLTLSSVVMSGLLLSIYDASLKQGRLLATSARRQRGIVMLIVCCCTAFLSGASPSKTMRYVASFYSVFAGFYAANLLIMDTEKCCALRCSIVSSNKSEEGPHITLFRVIVRPKSSIWSVAADITRQLRGWSDSGAASFLGMVFPGLPFLPAQQFFLADAVDCGGGGDGAEVKALGAAVPWNFGLRSWTPTTAAAARGLYLLKAAAKALHPAHVLTLHAGLGGGMTLISADAADKDLLEAALQHLRGVAGAAAVKQ